MLPQRNLAVRSNDLSNFKEITAGLETPRPYRDYVFANKYTFFFFCYILIYITDMLFHCI